MVSDKYEKYDPAYDYPPDLARALAAEEALEQEEEALESVGSSQENSPFHALG